VHRLTREVNRSLVLDVLREGGVLSRVDLARRTRLSKPTVSVIVDELLRDGVVREVGLGPSQPRGGRPPALLVFNDSLSSYAGIQLGPRLLRVAVADGVGRVLVDTACDTPRGSAQHVVRKAVQQVRTALGRARVDAGRLSACGVTVAGVVDTEWGHCIDAPALGWQDVDLRGAVEASLDVPVVVAPAVAAATVAEGRLGRAAGHHTYALVHAGRAVDAGIVIDGALLHGHSGRAGGLGHCTVVDDGPLCHCGNRGCLDTVASVTAVVAHAAAALSRGEPSALHRYRGALDGAVVAQAAGEGDDLAGTLVRNAGRMLGRGVAYLLNLLDPGMVVVGGPLAHAGPLFFDAVHDGAAEHVPRRTPLIEPAALGANAPLLGIVQLAVEHGTPSYRIVGRDAVRR